MKTTNKEQKKTLECDRQKIVKVVKSNKSEFQQAKRRDRETEKPSSPKFKRSGAQALPAEELIERNRITAQITQKKVDAGLIPTFSPDAIPENNDYRKGAGITLFTSTILLLAKATELYDPKNNRSRVSEAILLRTVIKLLNKAGFNWVDYLKKHDLYDAEKFEQYQH